MPGVTTRKPRVNRRLWGCRTALTVCHAISIAHDRGLASTGGQLESQPLQLRIGIVVGVRKWSRNPLPVRPVCCAPPR